MIGALLALAGTVILLRSIPPGAPDNVAPFLAVYGAALVALFTASSIYHVLPASSAKRLFRGFDHAGIFLLIAGTYTPFCLLLPLDDRGVLLTLVWTLAALGIGFQVATFLFGGVRHYEKFAFALYLGLGWIPILVAGRQALETLAAPGLQLLVAGGLTYSLGIIFYLWRRVPFGHAVWHLFVLGGSSLHFLAVLFYVIPGSA